MATTIGKIEIKDLAKRALLDRVDSTVAAFRDCVLAGDLDREYGTRENALAALEEMQKQVKRIRYTLRKRPRK
jgi:hypothetical protein